MTGEIQRDRRADDGLEFYTATAPATSRHRQLALAVISATILGYLFIIPNAAIPLAQVNSFIPAVYAIVVLTDFVVAVLLFAQCSATGSRPLLVLASGYLFASLMVVAHALTFPGAFSDTGMLGAGPQTSAWLNVFWRFGIGAAIALYAALRSSARLEYGFGKARRQSLWRAAAFVCATVAVLTILATAGHAFLPPVLQSGEILPLGRFANAGIALTNLSALVLLLVWTRGRSILDLWLIVATIALLAESTFVTFFVLDRYSLGFYAMRAITVPVSNVVLVVLLWETMRLYVELADSNRQLRRERANRLTNAAMGLAAFAHDVRQPLAGIALTASVGVQTLERAPANAHTEQAKTFFAEIRDGAARASEAFVGLLKLFRGEADRGHIDINALTIETTRSLRNMLDDRDVTLNMTLASHLPPIQGHAEQLREVLLSLVQHSIDAMAVADLPRAIDIETSRIRADAVSISIRDAGPALSPQKLASLFDPFLAGPVGGGGLSLAICKMIVEHHGGTLTAASDERSGVRLDIMLPAAS